MCQAYKVVAPQSGMTCGTPQPQDNVIELYNQGGRQRWRIEYEGFIVQKIGGYQIEHADTNNETGMKVFYSLLQIACILAQLIDKGDLLARLFKKGFGSAKNFAFRLLEATRNASISIQDYQNTIDTRIQSASIPHRPTRVFEPSRRPY